ncbi:DUF6427 family protein [Salegentibacter sp. HM20]
MLTSFFSKSKPINGIAIAIFMAVFFVIANLSLWDYDLEIAVIGEKLGSFLAFLLSAYVLNFIAKKNELTRRSAYKVLFFALFTCSFFPLLVNHPVIFSNLFVLLAFRRIISLRSNKDMQMKIFDASFWIFIASLFYFWSILFILLVYVGVLFYLPYFKNWLIPPVAFLAVALLSICFHLLAYEEIYWFWEWHQSSNFDFSNYRELKILIPLSIFLSLLLWTLGTFLKLINKANVSMRASLNLVLVFLGVAASVAILAPTKNGSELIFFFVPLSIVVSNYFDRKKDKIFKEILLALLILLPFVLPFL